MEYKCKRCGATHSLPQEACGLCGGEVDIPDYKIAFSSVSKAYGDLYKAYWNVADKWQEEKKQTKKIVIVAFVVTGILLLTYLATLLVFALRI